MRNKCLVIWSMLVLCAGVFWGCKKNSLSNDIIQIHDYKNLEVTVSENMLDSSEGAQYEDAIWEALIAECEFSDCPQDEVDALAEELKKQYGYVSYYDGKTGDEFIQDIHGISAEELAKQQILKKYAIQLIAQEEDILLSEEEYAKVLSQKAQASGLSEQEYENMFGAEELKQLIIEERVLEILKEYIK